MMNRRANIQSLVRKLSPMLSAALMALSLSGPASAALFEDDEARKAILDLRSRVQELRGTIDRSEERQRNLSSQVERIQAEGREKIEAGLSNTSRAQLELAGQLEALRQDMARLRGQIETLVNDVSNVQQRQKDFYVDLDARLRKLEPQQATIDGKTAMVDQNENRTFEAAMSMFRNSDFRNAVTAFDAFMRQYPGSALAPSAQYWMGTSLYAQRDYKGAIAAQQTLLKNWPESPRAPEAMLNIASSQIDLKETRGARKTLQDIIAKYPKSPTAGVAKERLATLK